MTEKRRIKAEDLYAMKQLQGLDLSPDGRWLVYALQTVDEKTEKKPTHLWVVSTEGGEPRQFTHGSRNDSQPRWSPDGTQIAFVSNRDDEKQAQIYLLPFGGGEARPLTKAKGFIGSFRWSPDGKQIVMSFTEPDADMVEREKDEQKKKLGVVVRHITKRHYKWNGLGFTPKNQGHIWVVDVANGEATQLTKPISEDDDKYEETDPIWTPDGQRILFTSNRHEDPETNQDATDFYYIDAKGGEMQPLGLAPRGKFLPTFSPDGKQIAFLGNDLPDNWWQNANLFVMPADGSTPPVNLTGTYDFCLGTAGVIDLPQGNSTSEPVWSPDGSRLYFQVSHHGNTTLHSVKASDGSDLQTVVGGEGIVGAFRFNTEATRAAYFFIDPTTTGQLRWQALNGEHPARVLVDPNAELMAQLDLGAVEEVWFTSPDGNNLQGWIMTPPGFDPNQQYPAVIEIHGGPMAMYANAFVHEFQLLAAHNFVVAYSNPRGGLGYGEAHTKAILGDWGNKDYVDLMAFTDLVAEKPFVDAERMGVTGGSYGGYMTLWVVGHTNRFKAAVTQRCVSNFISMWGASDMNWFFSTLFGGPEYGAPFERHDDFWRMSPMAHMGNCTTPTMIVHSEEDHRCPIDQGEQVYTALRYKGVPSEFMRFPGESHELSRSGRTDRRVVRLNAIKRWMVTYLNPEPLPAEPEKAEEKAEA